MLRALALLMLCTAALMAQAKKDEKKFKVSDEEQAVIDATNAERKAKKLPALKMSEKLMEAARAHAANMAKQNKMAHELDGVNVDARVKAAKYKFWRVGENVAHNQPDAKTALAGWMDSKPHRENILNEKYTEIGVGYVKNEKGEPYWCQVFGTPMK